MNSKDIYTEIAEKALNDGHKTYETMIVRIRLDGIESNEVLIVDPQEMDVYWNSDWYEGQHEVEYLWSVTISEVRK